MNSQFPADAGHKEGRNGFEIDDSPVVAEILWLTYKVLLL